MVIACSTSVRCRSPLEKALADIRKAGFAQIDLLMIDGWVHVNTQDLADRYEETVAGVDALLDAYSLTPIAVNSGVSQQLHDRSESSNRRRREEIRGLLRFMADHGLSLAAIQPRQPDRSRPEADVFGDAAATVREQVAMGAGAGVTFALELHANSPFETLDQARRLLAEIPDLPLIYDPTHFVMSGVDLAETAWLMDHARHVHLRDAAPGAMQTPLDRGTIDFDWLLGTLRDSGYTGDFSIEYLETDQFEVLEDAQRLRDRIAAYFE